MISHRHNFVFFNTMKLASACLCVVFSCFREHNFSYLSKQKIWC